MRLDISGRLCGDPMAGRQGQFAHFLPSTEVSSVGCGGTGSGFE